jgi:hypothetical protein
MIEFVVTLIIAITIVGVAEWRYQKGGNGNNFTRITQILEKMNRDGH